MEDIENWYKIYEEKRPTLYDKAIIELGKEIKRRKKILKKEFIEIMSWKLTNRNYVRYFTKNSQKDLDSVFNEDFFINNFGNDKTVERIEKLSKLDMVGVSSASAILSVIFPKQYGVIDKFSLKGLEINYSLGQKEKDLNTYLDYLDKIRKLAFKLHVTPKEIDSALMTKGFYLNNRENPEIKNKLFEDFQKLNEVNRKKSAIKFIF